MENKVYSMLSLCMKAGKLVSGEFATENALKDGKVYLMITPEDASDNTKKKFSDMCAFRNVPYEQFGTKKTLGAAIGKEERSSIGIVDKGFSDAIRKLLQKA